MIFHYFLPTNLESSRPSGRSCSRQGQSCFWIGLKYSISSRNLNAILLSIIFAIIASVTLRIRRYSQIKKQLYHKLNWLVRIQLINKKKQRTSRQGRQRQQICRNRSGWLSSNRDVIWITTKLLDVLLDPFQGLKSYFIWFCLKPLYLNLIVQPIISWARFIPSAEIPEIA